MGAKGRLKAERYRWKSIIGKYEDVWLDSKQTLSRKRPDKELPAPTGPAELLSGYGMLSYAHYNSAILGDKSRLIITQVGDGLFKFKEDITRYETLHHVLSNELERSILLHLKISSLTVSELCDRLVSEQKVSKGDLHFHLLWLMKHGAIRLLKD